MPLSKSSSQFIGLFPDRRLIVVAGCNGDDSGSAEPASDTSAQEADGNTLPTAPDSERVDLKEPSFADPTTVDNPLFPISELHSALLLGNDEGNPLRIETVLLPEPKVIDVDGEQVETLVPRAQAMALAILRLPPAPDRP